MGDYDFGDDAEGAGGGQGPGRAPLCDYVAQVVVEDVDELVVDYFFRLGGVGGNGVFEFAAVVGLVGLDPGALR